MAKLEETAPPFHTLSTEEKLSFITSYREIRLHDLTSVPEFDLSKEAKVRKTASTKAREAVPKEKKVKVSSSQMDMLKQLGLI